MISFQLSECLFFSSMIAYLKRKKKLNSPNLKQLLVPVLEHLDFDNVYVTDSILKTVCNNCPYIRVLILKDCGYVVTDSVVEMLLRVSIRKYMCHIAWANSKDFYQLPHVGFCFVLLRVLWPFKNTKFISSGR